jgi:hypothetical protein
MQYVLSISDMLLSEKLLNTGTLCTCIVNFQAQVASVRQIRKSKTKNETQPKIRITDQSSFYSYIPVFRITLIR